MGPRTFSPRSSVVRVTRSVGKVSRTREGSQTVAGGRNAVETSGKPSNNAPHPGGRARIVCDSGCVGSNARKVWHPSEVRPCCCRPGPEVCASSGLRLLSGNLDTLRTEPTEFAPTGGQPVLWDRVFMLAGIDRAREHWAEWLEVMEPTPRGRSSGLWSERHPDSCRLQKPAW